MLDTNQPHYPSEYVLSNPFLTGDANVVFITYFFLVVFASNIYAKVFYPFL